MVKVVFISDTHNGHRKLVIPPCDVLIHCGDMTNSGSAPELREIDTWFGEQDVEHKVVIAGNM